MESETKHLLDELMEAIDLLTEEAKKHIAIGDLLSKLAEQMLDAVKLIIKEAEEDGF